jgi:RimJ/RimL family protein N-acetyltransferase
MPGALFLEGEKVNLRTVEKEDIEFLRDNINNPDVRKFLTVQKPINLHQQKDFFENVISSEEDVHLAICREEDIIGIISLEDAEDGRTASIGLWIDPEYHGNGYGTESVRLITDYGFKELNYHRIYARAYEENKGSQRIWEKLGFQKEGELREQVFYNGEFGDIYMYGVLEQEWD